MTRGFIGDWVAALSIVIVIYILVRPRSAGAEMVRSFSDAMAALVRTATNL